MISPSNIVWIFALCFHHFTTGKRLNKCRKSCFKCSLSLVNVPLQQIFSVNYSHTKTTGWSLNVLVPLWSGYKSVDFIFPMRMNTQTHIQLMQSRVNILRQLLIYRSSRQSKNTVKFWNQSNSKMLKSCMMLRWIAELFADCDSSFRKQFKSCCLSFQMKQL